MAQSLMFKFEKHPELPGSDILPNLKGKSRLFRPWTAEEKQTLIEAIREHGKDWKKIVPKFANRERA